MPTAPNVSTYIASIQDFGSLAPVAHIVGKAIFDLDKEDTKQTSASGGTWSGVALDSWTTKAAEYEAEMEKLARVVTDD